MNFVIGFVCGVVGLALAVVMFIVGVLAGFSLALVRKDRGDEETRI